MRDYLNPLNAELNPICHLLALLGAHPIFHINRIRVKLPTFLGAFAKLRKAAVSLVMSVCLSVLPHGTTQLRLDGFLLNFVFEFF